MLEFEKSCQPLVSISEEISYSAEDVSSGVKNILCHAIRDFRAQSEPSQRERYFYGAVGVAAILGLQNAAELAYAHYNANSTLGIVLLSVQTALCGKLAYTCYNKINAPTTAPATQAQQSGFAQ